MKQKWKYGLLLLLITIIIITTPFFGRVETKHFSAYAACRKEAMKNKAYGIWKHERTHLGTFTSLVTFDDGFNYLSCQAVGIGPFWIVRSVIQTLVGCGRDLGGGDIEMCPEDYFGVNP